MWLIIIIIITIIIYAVTIANKKTDKRKSELKSDKYVRAQYNKQIYVNKNDIPIPDIEATQNASNQDYELLYAGFDTIEFSLAGLHYRSHAAKEAATDICNGTDLSLKLNPSNEYDSTAVKVFYENYHIGFAPSSDSEEVTNFIKTHKNISAIAIDVDEVYNDNFDDYETIIEIKVYGEKVVHKQKKRIKPNSDSSSAIYFKEHASEMADKKISKKYHQPNLNIEDKTSVFFDKSVVITGMFSQHSRQDVAEYINSKGGYIRHSITSTTDMVVIGSINPGPAKLLKIEELLKTDTKLKIIQEDEFLELFTK